MTEQDAVERVSEEIERLWWFGYDTAKGVDIGMTLEQAKRAAAAAAITAYNAWLRERATDTDVVEAVVGMIWDYALTRDENEETAQQALTAALDAMIGKENHDDRG